MADGGGADALRRHKREHVSLDRRWRSRAIKLTMKWYQMLHRAEKKPSEAGFTGDVERAKRESRFSFQSRGAGKTGEAGFTLLLAALVGSIVLSIGSSLFFMAQTQLILSPRRRGLEFGFS